MCENRLELFVQNVFRKQLIMASKGWDTSIVLKFLNEAPKLFFLHQRHVDDTLVSFWTCPQFPKFLPVFDFAGCFGIVEGMLL